MTEEEMRAALEECIRVCNSLLNALRDHSIPTEERVSAARYRVWTISQVIEEHRRQLDRYKQQHDALEREARTLEEALAQSHARLTMLEEEQALLQRQLDTVQTQLAELRAGCETRQQGLDAARNQLEAAADQGRRAEKKAPPAAAPGKAEEDAPGGDDPALFSTLELQNRIAMGLR